MRETKEVRIVTDRGTITGTYDPMFKTVRIEGIGTVPERELAFWVKAFLKAKVTKIVHSNETR